MGRWVHVGKEPLVGTNIYIKASLNVHDGVACSRRPDTTKTEQTTATDRQQKSGNMLATVDINHLKFLDGQQNSGFLHQSKNIH